MLQSLKTSDIDYRLLEGLSQKEIFHYFAGEILEKADQLTKEFLLKTAFLPSMTLEAAEKLTGLPAAQVLAALYEDHYFIERYLREKVAYRYHPLFREFLLSVAHTRLSPEEVRAIEREGARALLGLGQKEDAVDLLVSAQDWEVLVPVILHQAPALVSEGRSQTLEGWIRSLPEEVRSEYGWLLYWLAVCRQPYDPDGSRLLFDRSFTRCNETGDTAGALLAWSGAVVSITYGLLEPMCGRRQVQLLNPLIHWLDAFMASGGSFPSLDIEAMVASSMVAALMTERPYHPEFRAWADRAFMLSRSVASVSLRLQNSLCVAFSYMWLGNYAGWAMVVAGQDKTAKARDPVHAIIWRFIKATALNQMGPFDQSPLPLVEEGLKISSQSGVVVLVPMLLFEGCFGALDRGDFRKASDFLKQLESMLGGTHTIFDLRYHSVAALYHFRIGDRCRAVAHAQQVITFSPDDVGFFPAAAAYLCSAMILAAAGLRDEAREHIAAYRRLPQTPSRIMEYTSLIAEAALALDEEAPDALNTIRHAFRVGREEGFMTPIYCFMPSLMSRLCSTALKAGIELEYVRTMIRTRGLMPDEPSADVASRPWPLKIYTFGRVVVTVNDEPLSFSHKVQRRPLTLLKALIALGGKDVREDVIEDLLWPEAEGDAAHIACKTALSRLRSLLKTEGVIEVREGKLSLREKLVWVDTRALDTVADRVSDLWMERHARRVVDEAKEAASLLSDVYKGDFLETDDEPWIGPTRDRLRSKCLRAVEKLADILGGTEEDNNISALHARLIDASMAVKVDHGRLRPAEPHV